MYFLSDGSFKMVKNCKKRVNRGQSDLIFEWTGPFLDIKCCREIRKRQGFPKMTSVFHLYLSVFYKKLKTVEKSIFSIIFEWSRVFPENPAVSGTPTHHPLSLCQKSKKSLDRKYHNFLWWTNILSICSTEVENCSVAEQATISPLGIIELVKPRREWKKAVPDKPIWIWPRSDELDRIELTKARPLA